MVIYYMNLLSVGVSVMLQKKKMFKMKNDNIYKSRNHIDKRTLTNAEWLLKEVLIERKILAGIN